MKPRSAAKPRMKQKRRNDPYVATAKQMLADEPILNAIGKAVVENYIVSNAYTICAFHFKDALERAGYKIVPITPTKRKRK